MAEVRALPSAVGAFEAQVLNTASAYSYLMKQAAENKKLAAAQQKQVEERLYATLNDKRVIRANESDYIEGLRKDLEGYYFQNKDAISRGGSSYNELQKKMGFFNAEVTRSMSAKDQEKEILSYSKTIYDDPVKNISVSTEFKNAVAILELPINDQRRKDYRFKNQNGQEVGIEQLSINELQRIAYFTPDKLDAAVAAIPEKAFHTESYSKKTGQDITRGYSYTPPYAIWNVVQSFPQRNPGMLEFYKKQADAENITFATTGVPLQQRMEQELKDMDAFYTRAGASQKGAGFGSIMSLFSQDGIAGIDVNNPLEYALFQQLKANLPRDLGMSYDYKTASNWRANESIRLQKQNLYFQQKNYNEAKSLDGLLVKQIASGKFNSEEATNALNSIFGQKEGALGDLTPAKYTFDNKNKTMTVTTTVALFNPDGSLVTNIGAATILAGNNVNNLQKIATGGYGLVETKTFSIDPSNAGWEANISTALNLGEDAQLNKSTETLIKNLRSNAASDYLKQFQK